MAANGEHDGYLDVVSTPANFGSDLRRGDGRLDRIGEGALEIRADCSPGTPAPRGGTVSPTAYCIFRLLGVPSARCHDHVAPVACEIPGAAQSMDPGGQTTTVITCMTFVLPESAEHRRGAKSVSLRLAPLPDDGTLARNKRSSRRPDASVKRPAAQLPPRDAPRKRPAVQ